MKLAKHIAGSMFVSFWGGVCWGASLHPNFTTEPALGLVFAGIALAIIAGALILRGLE